MKKYFIACVALVCGTAGAYSQTEVSGYVYRRDAAGGRAVLQGASVHDPATKLGVTTAADGSYSLTLPEGARRLVAAFLGFRSDTVAIGDRTRIDFTLAEDAIDAGEIVIEGRQLGTSLSRVSQTKVEMINQAGLRKMACCTLAESFENSATVTVGFTDAVSGAKQVQLLGLAGIYSQMMAENVPTMRGLASTYGWSFTPGTWLESIYISKGASSVVNGYESISGQMNLEFKKPNDTEELFINIFGDDGEMFEGTVTAATKVAPHLWTGLMLNGALEDKVHDHNGDGFMDMPRRKFVNLYNRWTYMGDRGLESRTGVKFLWEDRQGGQVRANEGQQRYATAIMNRNVTVENKTGFPVGRRDGQSIGIITSFSHHELGSTFGAKQYDGRQNSVYANVLFNSDFGSAVHTYTAGASFVYDDTETSLLDRPGEAYPHLYTPAEYDWSTGEAVSGVFGQYTFTQGSFTLMLGARGDYNSRYGWLFTPRANVRYDIRQRVVFRASAGRGFRSPNVIAENIGLLASSRRFDASDIDQIGIEEAWNWGGNVSFHIPVWSGREMTLSLDYFNTRFSSQAVVDMERDADQVYFYALDGRSTADVFQADLSLELFDGFDFFAAFRYNDTRVTYTDGGLSTTVEKPLMSRYRGLVNLAYATKFKKWVFDVTLQVNGPARLPSLTGYAGAKGSAAEYSPVFPVWFAQVTHNTKRFDIYVGVENAFDFRQHHPIMGADDPFAAGFDSSRVWGPLMGRRIYAGVRLRIGKF